ncbi:MarR family winged helix-turn-helix transcriptional regulator [Emcibacter nanhaiensis]|uniref:Winged helix-turn-helix transcriptional regulator n=1 Tax=Emcibacter nanhaiensis TaxID=1505037 RepID=A0A501PA71_9PROT|nr:MarR family winged helix-turn-helix transcriptional regulator [Emcibacter nanhaiensis]TPD57269.1 winged helix-turn-helix transcriptional regulator [Emcibacter nanhaiensis]
MTREQIGESLHTLMHTYRRAMRTAYRRRHLPLSIPYIRALKMIRSMPDCTARDVGKRLRRDKGQITRVIKELLAERLIERHPHPEDKRSQILMLTDKGRETLTTVTAAENEAAADMVQGLTAGEIEEFTRLSQVMVANLDKQKPARGKE